MTLGARLRGGLCRMRLGRRRGAPSGPPPITYDYTITNDAEFTALKGLGGATLSGKSVLIDGDLGTMTFTTLAMTLPLVFYQTPGFEVSSIIFDGDVSKTIWHDVRVQGQGWQGGNIGRFSSGAQGSHEFWGCIFRHGYTAALLDTPIDNQASIPEIQKPSSTGAVTNVSSRIALPAWNEDTINGGWSNVQNDGLETIYVALGDNTITVDTSIANNDTLKTWIIPPGTGHTFDNLNFPHPTHLAVITATGTSTATVDMQQGLSLFQRDGWTQGGGGVTWPEGGPKYIGCTFQDLNNGVRLTTGLVMDCFFLRVYQDMIAGADPTTGPRWLRNIAFVGWGNAAHAQNPHGDYGQMSGDGSFTKSGGRIAGNVLIPAYDKADAMQGNLISDNDFDPSYDNFAFVGNVYCNTPGHAITNGEALWPCRNNFVVANTIIGKVTDIDYNGPIELRTGDYYSYLGLNIHGDAALDAGVVVSETNLQLKDLVGSRYAVFPDFDDLLTATTRAEVLAALMPAGAGAGMGLDVDAIDWTTDDPELVIKWENLPSGASWKFTTTVAPGSVQTTALAPVLNLRPSQPVVPGAGVEWRSTEDDGTTEVQAWTTSNGTIEPHQKIQIRFTATVVPATTETKIITMNGRAENVTYTTANNVPATYATVQGPPNTFFKDTANIPAGTTRLVGKAKIYMPTAPGAAFSVFGQATTAFMLQIKADRTISINVKDTSGTSVLGGAKTVLDSLGSPVVAPVADWVDIVFDANHTAQTATVTVNGVVHPAFPFSTPGTGSQRSITPVLIGSETSAGGVLWPVGTRFADLEIWRNGVLHKAIPNGTAANSDPWKQGTDAA